MTTRLVRKIVLPLPFPQVQHVNVYIVGKKDFILVDTGTSLADSYNILLMYLREKNIRHLDGIYLTHGHIDHFGAAGKLVKEGIADKVYIHESEKANIGNRYNEEVYGVYLRKYGIPAEIMEMMRYATGFFDSLAERLEQVSYVQPGSVIGYDGGAFEVIHTPGHTSGSICFFDRANDYMLSGDTLLSRLSPNPLLDFGSNGNRRRSLVEYIASLDMLYNMDIGTVFPGHYETIHDHRALIKTLLTFHYKRMMRIHNIIKPQPLTLYEIVLKLFRNLKQPDVYLAASEVIGHIDLLEQHDMVRSFEKEGLLYYAAE